MKKLLFILAAASIMIGAGSCHRDEPAQNSQTAEVKSASPNLQIDDNTQAVVTLDDGTQIINLINGTQIVTRNDDSSQFEVYNYDNAQVIMRAYADPDEKVEFTITLLSGGDHKTCVIKKVREITGFGLKEAKKLVDGAPSVIIQNISKELTDIYWNMLINCGGKIIVMIS